MKIATVTLRSLGPYSQSRRVEDRKPKEEWNKYEQRIWRERLHCTDDGTVFIPPIAFKRSLETAARYLRERIKDKGRSEYGKHFLSGVIVKDALMLPLKRNDVEGEWLYLSGSGKKGGMDVLKCMPVIRDWTGQVVYYVLDDIIGCDVFEKHLKEAGSFIGLGRFRPEKGGYYGRYAVDDIQWVLDAVE